MQEILVVARNSNVTKTRIVYKCNLSFEFAQKLIDRLVKDKLILLDEFEGRRVYTTSRKGLMFLMEVERLFAMMNPISLLPESYPLQTTDRNRQESELKVGSNR